MSYTPIFLNGSLYFSVSRMQDQASVSDASKVVEQGNVLCTAWRGLWTQERSEKLLRHSLRQNVSGSRCVVRSWNLFRE